MSQHVFLIDDDPLAGKAVQRLLRRLPVDVSCFSSAEDALPKLQSNRPEIIITDIRMPGISGLEFMSESLAIDPDIPIIVITGAGDIQTAVQALRQGAFDFIEKTNLDTLLVETVQRALRQRALLKENASLKQQLGNVTAETKLIGASAPMIALRETLAAVSDTDANVLIFGETGTGKELAARILHEQSSRRSGHFVAVNCGAIPESIFDSEMFGHVAGAFTGASKLRIGKVEHASGGTLFLDEVDSMPLNMQVKLLRVIQELTLERLGSNESIPINVRIVAATQTDLNEHCKAGEFREDLYYRLNVIPVEMPPLRERGQDISMLFRYFLERSCERFGREGPLLTNAHHGWLISRDWPGNVRELQNLADRVALTGTSALAASVAGQGEELTLPELVCRFEKEMIEQQLMLNQGAVDKTYEALGIPRKTFYDKMKKYGISRSDFVSD
jgi:two-component system C4-dicarboxylate transport response regulator DctD